MPFRWTVGLSANLSGGGVDELLDGGDEDLAALQAEPLLRRPLLRQELLEVRRPDQPLEQHLEHQSPPSISIHRWQHLTLSHQSSASERLWRLVASKANLACVWG